MGRESLDLVSCKGLERRDIDCCSKSDPSGSTSFDESDERSLFARERFFPIGERPFAVLGDNASSGLLIVAVELFPLPLLFL